MARLFIPLTSPGSLVVKVVFDILLIVKTKLSEGGLPIQPPVTTLALIDTGASMCLLHPDLIGQLGLPRMSEKEEQIITAGGVTSSKPYYGCLHLADAPGISVSYAKINAFRSEEPLPFGAVLGMNVLMKWKLHYRPVDRGCLLGSEDENTAPWAGP